MLAVLDVGKTNVRLVAADPAGRAVETRACPNPVRAGPPWPHHDLDALTGWVAEGLAALARRHPIAAIVPLAHGAAGVLVGDDPDAPGGGAVAPMFDYEGPCPPAIDADYADAAGPFAERGSRIMGGMTHGARQLFRIGREAPEALLRARWWLNLPQYWSWWLSGVAASELSALGAQSHLWSAARGDWAAIVAAEGWARLMPPIRPAGAALGPLRPELARRHGLPRTLEVLCGAHDSSAHLHRFRAAGPAGATLLSTGTWIVAMAEASDPAALDPARGQALTLAPDGSRVATGLALGGRAFEGIAAGAGGPVALPTLAALVARGTLATPGFAEDDGPFPGTAGRGRILGPPPEGPAERRALALLHVALLAAATAGALGGGAPLILDGAYLAEPLFAPLVAALRPGADTLVCTDGGGTVAGAAALLDPRAAAPALARAAPLDLPGLDACARAWARAASG